MSTLYETKLPDGWTGGEAITKWWRGSHVHLHRLRRPCAQCGTEMTIDVTAAALKGEAKNSGLLLKRCAGCRNASKQDVGGSRPKTIGQPPVQHGAPAVVAATVAVAHDADLAQRLKEAEDDHAATLHAYGRVRKAINEQLGLPLLGDGITYDTVTAAIRELKGTHELLAAMKQAAENKLPWE